MFGLFGKKRYVVATVMLGLNGTVAAPLLGALNATAREIIADEGAFEVASQGVSQIAGALLDYETAWTHSANWGEVFNKEDQAGNYAAENFAECSSRYLSSGDGQDLEDEVPATTRPPQNLVVMLTVSYMGEIKALESPLTSGSTVRQALEAIMGLHNKDQLQVAHLHYAPAHFGEDLDEDQLLINYPELVAL